jgi:hypothetical protein
LRRAFCRFPLKLLEIDVLVFSAAAHRVIGVTQNINKNQLLGRGAKLRRHFTLGQVGRLASQENFYFFALQKVPFVPVWESR